MRQEAAYTVLYLGWPQAKGGQFPCGTPWSCSEAVASTPRPVSVKTRVQPEQITINIGKDANVPPPPEGHQWKEVKHDQEGTWLAMWQENINGNYKYVMLAANSDVKGQSDYKKFEKARELKKHIDKIRKDYEKNLKHDMMAGPSKEPRPST